MKNIKLKKGTQYFTDGGCLAYLFNLRKTTIFKQFPMNKNNWETKDPKAKEYVKFRLAYREYAYVKKEFVIYTDELEKYAGYPLHYMYPTSPKKKALEKKYGVK